MDQPSKPQGADYHRVERAVIYLERNFQRQPGLEQVARHVGLSKYHLQRLFARWVGVSPKRFLQFLTVQYAKQMLAGSRSVLATSHASHLGQPRASRAVGSAVARNPISYLIPCHRVLRASGVVSGYRWGVVRKRALLGWEAAQSEL